MEGAAGGGEGDMSTPPVPATLRALTVVVCPGACSGNDTVGK